MDEDITETRHAGDIPGKFCREYLKFCQLGKYITVLINYDSFLGQNIAAYVQDNLNTLVVSHVL
nr:hypothetical protein [Thermanaeromonas sp. C210]